MNIIDTVNYDWQYYKRALVPNCAPHLVPDLTVVMTGEIWKYKWPKKPLFIRYTTDFDCYDCGDWYYVIKDSAFDIASLKAKQRNVVNKGYKNFVVKTIAPKDYLEELYGIQQSAFQSYPSKYRPKLSKHESDCWLLSIQNDVDVKKKITFGAFSVFDNKICGFIICEIHSNYIAFNVLRVIPSFEKQQINAALVYGMLLFFQKELENNKKYICDGERNINHETHFQDYLIKYFGFRKAYCNLHIVYRKSIRMLVNFLYVFRKMFKKLDFIRLVHNLNCILLMEDIARKKKENE